MQVRWIKQQVVKHRIKRDLIDLDPPPNSRREERSRDQNGQGGTRASRRAGSSAIRARSVSVNLNDPRWTQMWYLVSAPFFLLNFLLICLLCPLIVLAVGDDPDDSGFRYFCCHSSVLLLRSPERDVPALLDRLHTIRL